MEIKLNRGEKGSGVLVTNLIANNFNAKHSYTRAYSNTRTYKKIYNYLPIEHVPVGQDVSFFPIKPILIEEKSLIIFLL